MLVSGSLGLRTGPDVSRMLGRDLLVPSGPAQLADNAIESRRHALRPADLIFLACGVPIKLERPALRTVLKQTAQREPDLDATDRLLRDGERSSNSDLDGEHWPDAVVAAV